jgi:RNA polymerase sigma factor (sigma-70 family)
MQPHRAERCLTCVRMETSDSLCERLAARADGAFAELVVAHQDLVFGVALRVVADPATAEDVAQDAFVRAYRALGRYDDQRIRELQLRAWLARIALNAARNALRARRQHSDLDDAAAALVAPDASPLRLAEQSDERRMWARLLAGLPDRYRLAVALRYVDDLSYAELAEVLERPLGTVKSDVHRGVALLRAAYDAEQRALGAQEAV